MYEFRDTIDTEGTSTLPSEAMMINGEYIEDLIPGYRTLTVTGREALSPDVSSITTGARDGSILKNKRFPERILTIEYQLIAASNAAFRSAYNELGRILNVENAELVFADEDDKYYVGTPCTIEPVEPGRNAVIGSFEILCTDPFKYSLIEHYALPDLSEDSILIDYQGTYKSYPTLIANFASDDSLGKNGECGYVAFFDEDKKIIQLGDPEEIDGAMPDPDRLLTSSVFDKTSTANASISKWQLNKGTLGATTNGVPGIVTISQGAASSVANKKILEKTSTVSAPDVKYVVSAKSANRKSGSVDVTFTVTASLTKSTSYFLSGYILKAALYLGGKWNEVTIKKSTDQWRGKTAHTVSKKVTVTGLTAAQTKLTGVKFKAYRGDNNGECGTISETKCSDINISAYTSATSGMYLYGLNKYAIQGSAGEGYGSGNGWHGTSLNLTLPKDSQGSPCGANWSCRLWHHLSVSRDAATANKETGAFLCNVLDADGIVIAGFAVSKTDTSNKDVRLHYMVNDGWYGIETIRNGAAFESSYCNYNTMVEILKMGDTVKFKIGNTTKTYTNSAIPNKKPVKVEIYMLTYGSNPQLEYNGVRKFEFYKAKSDKWEDLPNTFNSGDVLEADCKNAEIKLNGVLAPQLGALGNDWEQFYLTPGLNQIGFSYSNWVTSGYEPEFKLRYREVYL